MTSHATVTELNGSVSDWSGLKDKLKDDENVVGSAPYVQFEAMLNSGDLVSGAVISGILPLQEAAVSDIADMTQKPRAAR